MALPLEKYLRMKKLPHIWCPGCGHGIITQAIVRAVDELGLDTEKTVIVSGIGCSARARDTLTLILFTLPMDVPLRLQQALRWPVLSCVLL